MFCPDCGTENLRGQKFCTRCGSNLMALWRARDIVTELATGNSAPQVEASTVLKIIALISIFGMMFTIGGTIALMGIDEGKTPIPIFVALGGFGTIVMICKQLFKLISALSAAKPSSAHTAATNVSATTNRRLGEEMPIYHSVIEQPTQQIESQRQPKTD